MVIQVNKKKYELKFGYGALRNICEAYGYDKVSGINSIIKNLELDKINDPTFEQMEFIGQFVIAGVKSVDEKTSLSSDDVLDAVVSGALDFGEILEEFAKSLPKQSGGAEGK